MFLNSLRRNPFAPSDLRYKRCRRPATAALYAHPSTLSAYHFRSGVRFRYGSLKTCGQSVYTLPESLLLPNHIGRRLHIRPHKIKEIAADFKMSVTQHGGVFFPFGMRADDVYRAVAVGFGILHIAAEGDEGFAHLERIGGIVRNLAECGKGLQFFRAVHADFRAVIKQPVAALHAVERCGFAVAHLAEPACHAAQDVFLGYGANPIFCHCCLSIGYGFEAACTWVFRKCRLLFGFQTTYDTVWSSETFIAVLFYRSICDTSRTAPLSAEVAMAP